ALDIDVVVESSGHFRTKELMQQHIDAGAKQVILSAPAKEDVIPTVVLGVNEHTVDIANEPFLSNASCTTNCLAPLIKVLDDNFGVVQAFMTTIHSFTGDQRLVDAPHVDKRRGRSAAINIIPTTTGAAIAVGHVLPHLSGKLDGIAVRVPIADGSLTDVVCQLEKKVTLEQINHLFSQVSKYHLKNILAYSNQPLVSTDIITNPHSSIVDASLTKVQGNTVKLCAWYDNEWGYSNRLVDLLLLIASKKDKN
ncbi:MAG: type I glyceraldehyde-3-phosphate dehydrogenase, partial [Candidatus Nanoarchaeia archaeon]